MCSFVPAGAKVLAPVMRNVMSHDNLNIWVSEVMALYSVCVAFTLKYTEGEQKMTIDDQLAHSAEPVQTIFKASLNGQQRHRYGYHPPADSVCVLGYERR